MNSRERLLTAVSHKEPDKVPIDLNGHRSSGMSVQAYRALREYLGLPKSPIYVYDILQQLAIVEDDVLDHFGVDVVQLGYLSYKDAGYWKEHKMHDGSTVMIPKHIDIKSYPNGDYYIAGASHDEICLQKTDCYYFEQTCFPYEDSEDEEFADLEEQLNEIMWFSVTAPPAPYSYDPAAVNSIGRIASLHRAATDRAIYGIFGGNLVETGQQAFRIDNFFMELYSDPDRMHKFLDLVTQMHMINLKKYLSAVGDKIDIIGFGDDMGMQTGPQFSVAMLEEFFIPRYKQMWDYVHTNYPHLKICLHCCGGVEPFLTPLAKAGLDCINPVQITCQGMGPSSLKAKHGDEIVFWGGGCDTRSILHGDSLTAIDENVHANIEAFKSGGGYVFQQVHNMVANVPPQNIVAMYEAVNKYRNY